MCVCVCVCVLGGGGSQACLCCSTKQRIRAPIYLFMGFLTILQVELQASTRLSKLHPSPEKPFLIYTPHPFCRSSHSLFTHTPFTFVCFPSFPCVYPIFPMFSLCVFPQCFSNQPLVHLLIPFIVSH